MSTWIIAPVIVRANYAWETELTCDRRKPAGISSVTATLAAGWLPAMPMHHDGIHGILEFATEVQLHPVAHLVGPGKPP